MLFSLPLYLLYLVTVGNAVYGTLYGEGQKNELFFLLRLLGSISVSPPPLSSGASGEIEIRKRSLLLSLPNLRYMNFANLFPRLEGIHLLFASAR